MIRQYANVTASTSNPNNTSNHSDIKGGTTASKVAEVFLTAGHAFQKLGDLTLQLHSSESSNSESKWTDNDVDRLKDALTRFAYELDIISESVQTRTTKLIKTDIKRRTLQGNDDLCAQPQTKRITNVAQIIPSNQVVTGKRSYNNNSNLLISGTTFKPVSISANSNKSIGYYAAKQRYNPINVMPSTSNMNSNKSNSTTIKLQSSPQPIATSSNTGMITANSVLNK